MIDAIREQHTVAFDRDRFTASLNSSSSRPKLTCRARSRIFRRLGSCAGSAVSER